jgi:CRP/FNR family transcriptional regulator
VLTGESMQSPNLWYAGCVCITPYFPGIPLCHGICPPLGHGPVRRVIILARVPLDPPHINNECLGAGLDVRDIEIAWAGPPQCRQCSIRDLVLFADLAHDDFQLIHRPIDELRFGVGEMLYRPADQPTHVYTVREGLVKLVQYLPNGGQRIVRLLRQGDVAGLEVLLGHSYQHEAAVLEPVLACRIPVSVIERLSHATPRLHKQLLARWQRAVSDADAWITDLSTGPAQYRVARLLLRLAGSQPGGHCYLPTREDIGAMVGITPETASRVVAELKRNGLISELDAKHAMLDRDGLDRIRLR